MTVWLVNLDFILKEFDLRGDRTGAAAALRQAITAAEKLYEHLRSEEYSEEDLNDQKMQIAKLREHRRNYGK